MKTKTSLYDTHHPARQKAIRIMEFIAEYFNKPKMFDCKNGNTIWYDVEDELTCIIANKK